ncbi:MAG TPA: MBL fold metallo-hydrolase, partial [Casimicrobiaceae bacterium]|nr:MBL fold metallo-hydrolase [Casimicrobiaceae bacterium]
MRLALHGGFAEKGRTSLGIETDGYHLLLDAGVKTSARGGADYWPALRTEELRALDAIVITHAHEDHVAALGWCIEHGFDGRIFMTRETARELDDCLAGYAEASHSARVQAAHIETLPLG